MKTLMVTLAINTPQEAMEYVGHHLGACDDPNGVRSKVDYVSKCRRCVEAYLEHTNFDILVATNDVKAFEDLGPRVKILETHQPIEEYKEFKGFNELIKLRTLRQALTLYDYDVHYFVDGDQGLVGWSDVGWERLINNSNYSVWGNSLMNKVDLKFYSGVDSDYAYVVNGCKEDRLIFTNREELEVMCDLWEDEVKWDRLFKHREWRGMGGSIGVLLGEAIRDSGALYKDLVDKRECETYSFTLYEILYTKEEDKILDRWGYKWNGPPITPRV